MNRLRLAALILTSGLTFFTGCTACYSVGVGNGNGNGGGFFNRNNGLCSRLFGGGSSGDCGPTGCSATPCCESGVVSGFEGPGPILMPQDSINMFPAPTAVPPGTVPGIVPPGAIPGATPFPAGSSTKLMPVPQSTPVPYTPAVH